ncbi:DUF6197 family protein [Streptomyces griseus]|uniref:DUF6197 family protein n=1 Tax=Streptomyces griseus TaxID=1911 RepID=UPI00340F7063
MAEDVSENLLAAADQISAHGWHQGALHPVEAYPNEGIPDMTTAPACAMGAIFAQSSDSTTGAAAIEHLRESLGLPGMESWEGPKHPVAAWNDDPSRTAEDVILALKRAAE